MSECIDRIKELFEETALKLVMTEADDLQGLAGIHTQFEQITEQIEQMDTGVCTYSDLITSVVSKLAEIIEKIILQDISDSGKAIEVINTSVQSLQTLIDQVREGREPGDIKFPAELGLDVSLPVQESVATEVNYESKQAGGIVLPENVDEEIFREFMANQPHVLANLEAAVLSAEKDPSEENRAVIKGILHNFKGEAALMGLEHVARVCHEAETLLAEEQDTFPGEKLLLVKDWLQNSMAELSGKSVSESSPPPADRENPEAKTSDPAPKTTEPAAQDNLVIAESDVPLVMDFINESNEHLESAEADLLTIEENPKDTEVINSIFRAFHTIKGVAGFLNLKQIGSLAHATENLLDMARKGNLVLGGSSIDVVFEALDVMKQMLSRLAEAVEKNQAVQTYPKLTGLIGRIKTCTAGESPKPRIGEILVNEGAASSRQVRDALHEQRSGESDKKVGEILVDKEATAPPAIDQALRIQQAATGSPGRDTKKVTTENTVKVTTSRLDALINMVGELVIAQSMVSRDVEEHFHTNQRLERNGRHLEKITRELQELSMSMRMVPVQGVFQKMARLVRDLSRKAGKEIEFSISGAETELDRNVVEAIADPLVHMVRNSVDHGIEPAADRQKAGKNPVGRIELSAYHQGGNIVIEITDDGRGLNRDKILKKAIAGGLVKEGQEMSDQDVYRLIFHAGLSTAEKITDVSGRGVGMDVVRKNIEALRGRVDIDSRPGRGSIFSIRLPLTLAVIDGQVMTVGQESYIIPTISIEQSLRPEPDQVKTVQGGRGEMVLLRGELVPLVRLYRLFGIEPEHTDCSQALIVVVADGQKRACLQVDSLLDQQQVVIKSLGDYLGNIKGVSGGAIMGDGNVSLILDVPGLINLAIQQQESSRVETAP
ncbi:MAG: Hpt domain-containing protein [Sedimentisphaerales bacterium]|nr:Hpt domain-containing protein [Sedimentisphaerales bacterium]